jgi:hypothetical protein
VGALADLVAKGRETLAKLVRRTFAVVFGADVDG